MKLLKSLSIWMMGTIKHPNRWSANAPRLTILTYHRVLPTSSESRLTEQSGMVISPENLSLHCQWLKEAGYSFIDLAEWPDRRNEEDSKNYVAITFDDGWYDNLEYALPVLKKHNIPATIYLVGNNMLTGIGYWPTELARFVCLLDDNKYKALTQLSSLEEFYNKHPSGELMDEPSTTSKRRNFADQLIEKNKHYSDAKMSDLTNKLASGYCLPKDPMSRTLTYQDWYHFKKSGIQAGSHTLNHTRLTTNISPDALKNEICASKEKLSKELNVEVSSFCYPNGDHNNESVRLVKQAYRTAVTTIKGINTKNTDLHCLFRLTMHDGIGATRKSFFSRINGWR